MKIFVLFLKGMSVFQIYDFRPDGVYVPVRYYMETGKRAVVLVGMVHVGEKSYTISN